MPHVSPNIKKFVRRDRLEQPFSGFASEARTQSPQGESHEAYVSFVLTPVQPKWNFGLQGVRIHLVMDEHGAIPVSDKQRLSLAREQPPFCRCVFIDTQACCPTSSL